LALWSEQANQYTKANATIGSNVVASPDGYTNADSLIEDTTNGAHAFFNFGLTTFTAAAHTASVFAKKGGRDWFALQLYDGSSNQAFFNLATGVTGSVTAGSTSTITSMGNGWYRCTITSTTAVSAGGIAIYSASANNVITYAGTNGLAAGYFYGWQLEAGAYATSYIPTLGTSVTRVADAASKSSATALLGQTAGTAFADLTIEKPTSGNADFLLLENVATPTDGVYVLFMQPSGQIGYFSYPSGAFGIINGVNYSGQRIKIAYAYSSAGFVVYINGSQVFSNGSVSLGTGLSRFGLNNPTTPTISTKVSQTLIFKTRLTNAQLAELTTL
jgi:hypothetical protein